MAREYGFFQMLKDMVFNGNEVSEEFKDKPQKDSGHEGWGGLGSDSSSKGSSTFGSSLSGERDSYPF